MLAGQLMASFIAGGALADEGGGSVYVPGQFASFQSVPDDPGFSFETIYYHRYAAAIRPFAFENNVAIGLAVTEDYVYLTPGYTFAQPVLGGQLYLGVTFAPGGASASLSATLGGGVGNTLSESRSDAMTDFGDISPFASLKWASGPHNLMAYVAVNVPVGKYDPNRIANLGVGHWAVDGGLGYTFLSKSGFEASLTAGLTKNFINPYTEYQSGTDGHLDWGMSYSPNQNFYFGVAGYVYHELDYDSGLGVPAGGFRSQVSAIGPQAGYSISTPSAAFEIDLRSYKEFDAVNRLEGWTVWFTVTLSRFRHGHSPR